MAGTSNDRLLRFIMLAVATWGSVLALGAFLYGLDIEAGRPVFAPSPARGLIVLACVFGFLGLWWVALRRKKSAPPDG